MGREALILATRQGKGPQGGRALETGGQQHVDPRGASGLEQKLSVARTIMSR